MQDYEITLLEKKLEEQQQQQQQQKQQQQQRTDDAVDGANDAKTSAASIRRELRRLQEEKERTETQLNDELEAVRQSNQKLRQQLGQKEQLVKCKAEPQDGSVVEAAQQLAEAKAELETLHSKLKTMEEEAEQLRGQLAAAKSTEELLQKGEGSVAVLSGELTAARAELDQVRAALVAAEARVQESTEEADWKAGDQGRGIKKKIYLHIMYNNFANFLSRLIKILFPVVRPAGFERMDQPELILVCGHNLDSNTMCLGPQHWEKYILTFYHAV